MTSDRYPAPPAIDLVERAVFLLRSRPASVWAVQAAGSVPLLLSVLYFAFDMSSQGVDDNRALTEALLCALCFLWFNVCRARFAQLLQGALSDRNPETWWNAFDPRNLAMQSCKLFAMPVALVAVVPLGWAVSLFRGSAVFAGRGGLRRSAKTAAAWQGQAWLVLSAMALLSAAVFLNLLAILAVLPSLVRIASGVENDFTRLGLTLNWTVPGVAAGLTWLLLDPLYQAVFCVRAFLLESRETGLDLLFLLRHLVLVGVISMGIAPHANAQTAPGVTARELDKSVEQVLQQREYAWRLPRPQKATRGLFENLFAPVGAAFRRLVRWIGELIDRWFRGNPPAESEGKPSPFPAIEWTIVVLLVLFAAVLGFALVRFTRARAAPGTGTPAPAPAAPRLDDEAISAADLPEERWIAMGRDCLARGEYRLALRAFYLANLAWLGHRDLLTVTAFKSNRDYWRELRRRAANEAVEQAFAENMRAYERGWYGMHEVDAGQIVDFEQTSARMRGYVEA